MKENRKILCPRCSSSKYDMKINGDKRCLKCGQKWNTKGRIQSIDRRYKPGDPRRQEYQFDLPVESWGLN